MGVNVFLEGGASIGPDHCLSPPSADQTLIYLVASNCYLYLFNGILDLILVLVFLYCYHYSTTTFSTNERLSGVGYIFGMK